jgi:hypothetical protein
MQSINDIKIYISHTFLVPLENGLAILTAKKSANTPTRIAIITLAIRTDIISVLMGSLSLLHQFLIIKPR